MIFSVIIFSKTMTFSSGLRICDDEAYVKRQRKSGIKQPGHLHTQYLLYLRETQQGQWSTVLAEEPATLQNLVNTWK